MNISQAITVVKEVIQNTTIVPFLIGYSGVGKSEGVRYGVAEALGYKMIDLRLAQMEPSDAIGMPRAVQVDGEWRTVYAKPWWFPGENDPPTLIFVDELPQAHRDVQAAFFQLLYDRHLFQWPLADQHKLVAGGNPAVDDYESNELGAALRSRLLFLRVDADLGEWLSWSEPFTKESHAWKAAREFISMNPDALIGKEEHFELDVRPNPRAWTRLANLFTSCEIPDMLQYEVASGMVGKEWATLFVRHMQESLRRPVSAREIMENYADVRDRILESTPDLLSATHQDILAYCANEENEINEQALFEFLKDIPAEFKMVVAKDLRREKGRTRDFITKSVYANAILDLLLAAKNQLSDEENQQAV